MRWAMYALVGFFAAALVGLAHELGHFIPAYLFGWQPSIRFANGGAVDFHAHPEPAPALLELISLLGGPVTTLSLAALCTRLARKAPKHAGIVIFGLWNAVFRFSVLIDGKGADEAKMSALLGVPYLFQSLSVVASAVISTLLVRRQECFPRRVWLVAPAFIAFAVCYVSSLRLMSWVFR